MIRRLGPHAVKAPAEAVGGRTRPDGGNLKSKGPARVEFDLPLLTIDDDVGSRPGHRLSRRRGEDEPRDRNQPILAAPEFGGGIGQSWDSFGESANLLLDSYRHRSRVLKASELPPSEDRRKQAGESERNHLARGFDHPGSLYSGPAEFIAGLC